MSFFFKLIIIWHEYGESTDYTVMINSIEDIISNGDHVSCACFKNVVTIVYNNYQNMLFQDFQGIKV